MRWVLVCVIRTRCYLISWCRCLYENCWWWWNWNWLLEMMGKLTRKQHTIWWPLTVEQTRSNKTRQQLGRWNVYLGGTNWATVLLLRLPGGRGISHGPLNIFLLYCSPNIVWIEYLALFSALIAIKITSCCGNNLKIHRKNRPPLLFW